MMMFDPHYLLWIAPALILAAWAQFRVKSAYATAQQVPAPLSGAAAARHILDSAGMQNVEIEQVDGFLSDHYDPRDKVLRLSPEVYNSRSASAVGIAAHEAGHAMQDAQAYALMGIRNAAVPMANFGSNASIILLILGAALNVKPLIWLGIIAFAGIVFFQLVNLPVEFDASRRAKAQLATLGICGPEEMTYVRRVLNAAAWTYVAATLQAVLTLLYYIVRFAGGDRRD